MTLKSIMKAAKQLVRWVKVKTAILYKLSLASKEKRHCIGLPRATLASEDRIYIKSFLISWDVWHRLQTQEFTKCTRKGIIWTVILEALGKSFKEYWVLISRLWYINDRNTAGWEPFHWKIFGGQWKQRGYVCQCHLHEKGKLIKDILKMRPLCG